MFQAHCDYRNALSYSCLCCIDWIFLHFVCHGTGSNISIHFVHPFGVHRCTVHMHTVIVTLISVAFALSQSISVWNTLKIELNARFKRNMPLDFFCSKILSSARPISIHKLLCLGRTFRMVLYLSHGILHFHLSTSFLCEFHFSSQHIA